MTTWWLSRVRDASRSLDGCSFRSISEPAGHVLEVLDHFGQVSGGHAESWCVGEGVVEALQRACRFDRDGEVLAFVPIDHLDEECVRTPVPEEADVDRSARAVIE